MPNFKYPIIGQEAVVPNFGLGRVESYKDALLNSYVEVKPYICGYSMKFSPENVKLIKVNLEREEAIEAFIEADGNQTKRR